MKILLICPDDWNGLFQDDLFLETESPLTPWQAQYFFWRALKKLNHEVSVFRYTDGTRLSPIIRGTRKLGSRLPIVGRRIDTEAFNLERRSLNRDLRKLIEEFQPELLLVSGGNNTVLPETLSKLAQNPRMKTALLYMDSPIVSTSPEQRESARFYDAVFCNDKYHAAQWRELRAKHVVALPLSGCDTDYHSERRLGGEELLKFKSEICFVGSLLPTRLYENRIAMLESLCDLPLAIWTDHKNVLENHPKLARLYRGSALGPDMVKAISASKICLNNHGCTMQAGGNMRTFETASIGTLQIVDRCEREWFKDGEEIVCYSDFEDLRRKIIFYLQNEDERKRIALRGRTRAQTNHTYINRMDSILSVFRVSSAKAPTYIHVA